MDLLSLVLLMNIILALDDVFQDNCFSDQTVVISQFIRFYLSAFAYPSEESKTGDWQ